MSAAFGLNSMSISWRRPEDAPRATQALLGLTERNN